MTANSSRLEQIKYIYGCSEQYVKRHFPINKYFYENNIEHKLSSVGFLSITASSDFLYIYNLSHLTKQRRPCR